MTIKKNYSYNVAYILFSSVHHLEREQKEDQSLTKVGTEEPSSFDDIPTTHGKKMFRCMVYSYSVS
jgi:hypothetical protein